MREEGKRTRALDESTGQRKGTDTGKRTTHMNESGHGEFVVKSIINIIFIPIIIVAINKIEINMKMLR